MLEKWCQHSPDTELPQTFKLFKKKKTAVSAKHSKTRYACIRNPVLVYRNSQNSEQLLKYTMGFCQHECYVKTYFHKPLEKEIDLLSFPFTSNCEM